MHLLYVLFCLEVLQHVSTNPIGDNLAFNKEVSVSGILMSADEFGPTFAIDNDPQTCTITNKDKMSWWSVDLGDLYDIDAVSIVTPESCGSSIELKYWIRIGDRLRLPDSETHTTTTCFDGNFLGTQDQNINIERECRGRALSIVLNSEGKKHLTLCEVYIFGSLVIEEDTEVPDNDQTDLTTVVPPSKTTAMVDQVIPGRTPLVEPVIPTAELDLPFTETVIMESYFSSNVSVTPDPNYALTQPSQLIESRIDNEELNPLKFDSYEMNGTCQCFSPFCSVYKPANVDGETFIASIIDNLKIDTRNVSKERRRYSSAEDKRPSAQNMGSVGIVFIVLVFGSIVLLDAITFVQYLLREKPNCCHLLSRLKNRAGRT